MTRFLIVDDIEVNIYMLKVLLESNGYEVVTATNGKEALNLAQDHPPDIIVTDILMPEMDGFALCREWKQDTVLQNIPFVFYTATYTDPKDRKFALSLGADQFIIKPMETQELLAALQEVLTNNETRKLVNATTALNEAGEFLQEYNEVLFRKLEQKVVELEEANRLLEDEIGIRKQTEIALRESEQQYSLLFNRMSDAFAVHEVIVDDEGKPIDFRFVRINPAFETLTGGKSQDVVGKTIRELFPTISDHYIELLGNVALFDTSERFEIYIPTLDKHFELFAFSHVKMQFATLFFDITERKQKQQFDREYERMKTSFKKEQERNNLVQEIISKLSHDMRTPLSVISASKDILKMQFEKLNEDKYTYRLKIIEKQIQFALELLDDTVWLIRNGVGEERFSPKSVNLTALCEVIIEEISLTYNDSHQVIFVNHSDQDMAVVDETLLSRIIMNLLTNAIKYSPPENVIQIELERDATQIILRVIDNGVGIPANEIPHIFDPLYRVQTSMHVQGTGLGLSIVKDCVDRHKGRIRVESEVEVGTTFTVELPVK